MPVDVLRRATCTTMWGWLPDFKAAPHTPCGAPTMYEKGTIDQACFNLQLETCNVFFEAAIPPQDSSDICRHYFKL
jgi:hypothetical protein